MNPNALSLFSPVYDSASLLVRPHLKICCFAITLYDDSASLLVRPYLKICCFAIKLYDDSNDDSEIKTT